LVKGFESVVVILEKIAVTSIIFLKEDNIIYTQEKTIRGNGGIAICIFWQDRSLSYPHKPRFLFKDIFVDFWQDRSLTYNFFLLHGFIGFIGEDGDLF
ncbi:hypothetical protein ACJX0J_028365, partial [Zea mays]